MFVTQQNAVIRFVGGPKDGLELPVPAGVKVHGRCWVEHSFAMSSTMPVKHLYELSNPGNRLTLIFDYRGLYSCQS